MQPVPVISSLWLEPFVHTLELEGAPVDRMLEAVKVPRAARERPDLTIAEPPVWAFVELAARRGGIEGLGFRVAQTHGLDSLGGLRRTLDRCPSLVRLVDVMAAAAPSSGFWLARLDDQVYFSRRGSGFERGSWLIEQYVLTLMIQVVRRAAGTEWAPHEVRLQTRAPSGLEETRCLDRATIHLGQPATAISIPEHLLAKPGAAFSDPGQPSGPAEPDWVGTLSRVLEPYFVDGYPSLDLVAEILGMNARTLQRRLREAGSSYLDVAARTRFSMARRLLVQPEVKLIDVAYELGYTDPGSFSRAFRSWTGLSPREFRRSSIVPLRSAGGSGLL